MRSANGHLSTCIAIECNSFELHSHAFTGTIEMLWRMCGWSATKKLETVKPASIEHTAHLCNFRSVSERWITRGRGELLERNVWLEVAHRSERCATRQVSLLQLKLYDCEDVCLSDLRAGNNRKIRFQWPLDCSSEFNVWDSFSTVKSLDTCTCEQVEDAWRLTTRVRATGIRHKLDLLRKNSRNLIQPL